MSETPLKIRLYGDPILREVSQPVEEVGVSERILISAMLATMNEHKGIGLAAPQVGIAKRIFVADVGSGPMVFINPRIVKSSGLSELEEGCLSIPDVQIKVQRPEKIVVQYTDVDNTTCELAADELLARVIQHENDHLDGKLIVDYIDLTKAQDVVEQLNKIQEQS